MSTPQQPELHRSGHHSVDKARSAKEDLQAQDVPAEDEPGGPVPEENRPGHTPEVDQDKPEPRDRLPLDG
jgi:hypothetical protein